MRKVLRLLRGKGIAPAVVALARGALEAAVFAAALFVLDTLNAANSPEWMKAAAPLAVFAWRGILEGFADQIDPSKSRR